jgi:predicted transcriptional regulator
MKLKHITVSIGGWKEGLDQFERVVRGIERGHPPKPQTATTHFVSLSAALKVLTPRRLDLMRLIRERHPHSLYELAHIAGRDMKNVHDDVALLERLGFVQLTRQRTSRRKIMPHVTYDKFRFELPFAHLAHA